MKNNIFTDLPDTLDEEKFERILDEKNILIERIISLGQTTPKGKWLSQKRSEWVVLLQGRAKLVFEKDRKEVIMKKGDWILIKSKQRHRVEWTCKNRKCVWLAVHF